MFTPLHSFHSIRWFYFHFNSNYSFIISIRFHYKMNSAIFNLEKICKSNNTEVKFIESNISGVVHQPEYTFRVDVGELSAYGKGQNRKTARHQASKAMIEKIINETDWRIENRDEIINWLKEVNESPEKPEVTEEDIDYVSKVKQLCDKKKWIQASFEDSGAEGPSHDRVFYVNCHLPRFDIYTQGSGKSKKLAKKVAACNLLRRLEEDNLLDIDNENSEKVLNSDKDLSDQQDQIA